MQANTGEVWPPGATVPDSWVYKVPTKDISSMADFDRFKASSTYKELLGFVFACCDRVAGQTITSVTSLSANGQRVINLLQTLSSWVDEIPPIAQPMRFGNRAFRTWHARLVERVPAMLAEMLHGPTNSQTSRNAPSSPSVIPSEQEISVYLLGSFGSEMRIDYGTGHEFNFLLFQYCLCRLGFLQPSDLTPMILIIFREYLYLVYKLLSTYFLEPAGSHGVWGLDDHFCLSFLFGAYQLTNPNDIPPPFSPSSVTSDDIQSPHNKALYLYISSLSFTLSIKKGGRFHETCPLLADISQMSDWTKIARGLLRYWEREVIGKYVVAQHVQFGSLIQFAV